MRMNQELKHWNTDQLASLGIWLFNKRFYGYSLLVIHATAWGMKINYLLDKKFGFYINPQTDEVYDTVTFTDIPRKENVRVFNNIVKDLTNHIWKVVKANGGTLDDYVYTNHRTGKQLNSSTLKRELLHYQDAFAKDLKEGTTDILPEGIDITESLVKLSTNTFEIAWSRDMVTLYDCSKKVFSAVSNYLGHQTLTQTEQYLGLNINDTVTLMFNLFPAPESIFNLEIDIKNDGTPDENYGWEEDKRLHDFESLRYWIYKDDIVKLFTTQ